jgi:hypothetical protein
MRSLTSNSFINFKKIDNQELPVYECNLVGQIDEASALRSAKEVFRNYNMKGYSKALYIQKHHTGHQYAIFGCYKFKRKFKKYEWNKTVSKWYEYEVFKIKYDTRYDNQDLYRYGSTRDDYVGRQNRTWYEND